MKNYADLDNKLKNLYRDLTNSHKPEHREIISSFETYYRLEFVKENFDIETEQSKMLWDEILKVLKRTTYLFRYHINFTHYGLDNEYGSEEDEMIKLFYDLEYLFEEDI